MERSSFAGESKDKAAYLSSFLGDEVLALPDLARGEYTLQGVVKLPEPTLL
jgi:hypothetical protein